MALSDNISKINIEQLDGLSSQVDTIKNLPVNFDKSLFADFAISQVKKLVNVEDLIRKLIERILKDLDICELMNSLPLDKVQSILKTLIKLRDEAINLLVKVLRVITSILSITTIISTLVTVFTTIVELIPIISAAIPMSFPPGIGLPAGIPVIFSKIYEMMLKFIKALGFILNLINDTLKTIAEKLSKFIDILKSITLDLFQCAEKLALAQARQEKPNATIKDQITKDKFNDLIGEITPIPEIDLGIQPESYKGFTFDIKSKKTVEGTPQNYAIALDVRGTQVLESLPSFASDTNVLIQELKLTIDRNRLSGF
jgi:hypothetical protein